MRLSIKPQIPAPPVPQYTQFGGFFRRPSTAAFSRLPISKTTSSTKTHQQTAKIEASEIAAEKLKARRIEAAKSARSRGHYRNSLLSTGSKAVKSDRKFSEGRI